MVLENRIWAANDEKGNKLFLSPKMANRHGLIAGATGTGKTITLKVLAESFSDMGVPVFLSDVKGDLAGMVSPGEDNSGMLERKERFSLNENGFDYIGYPVNFWDIYGEKGIQLRTTVSEMGPLLLSRILDLNDLQTDILSIIFKIADDRDLLLIDTKDLKAILNYVSENSKEFSEDYGNISKVTISAILRAVVSLEIDGGDKFFGERALDIMDLFSVSHDKGVINILSSEKLIGNVRLYSMFLLYLMSELFETLPEVGDREKPKMVFFFDEAHLLFKGAPKILIEKIEQVVKLIRSKGVGIYFVTQTPSDIPDGVLSQLGNKVQHALRAYTPSDQKAVKAAAASYRENPEFDTYETLLALGTGEAIVSFLDEDGVPAMVQKAYILPPQSRMGGIDESLRDSVMKDSLCYSKYKEAIDPDSAYEFLKRMGLEEEEAKQKEAEEAAAEKLRTKEEAAAQKAREKEAAAEEKALKKKQEQEEKAKKRVVKNVGSSVAGTVGREVGKAAGAGFGRIGKTIGGNIGASLGRGILSTLFKL
ncbi:MAG: DUF853 domain-containing protein [Lachnospiraceae bacterium]|nr:DUF853 domain-containing protein [Lachnospiraceae bacterium]